MVLSELRAQFIGRDLQIDQREVILKIDELVNERAKAGFLENWKLNLSTAMGEQFITRFEWLTITDPANKMPSYVTIPAHYADLPNNEGIENVYFKNDFTVPKKKYFDPIIINSYKDVAMNRNTVGEYLEDRISCHPKGGVLEFDRGNVGATYGDLGMSLVVRDSGAISDDAPYPISSDIENYVISSAIQFYRQRLVFPQDEIKDGSDVIKTK